VKPKKEKVNSGGSNRNNYNGGRGNAGGASFAQQGRGSGNNIGNNDQPWRCYCCGKVSDHFANTCPKRDEIPSSQWWNRTGVCHFQSGNEGIEDNQDEDQSIRSETMKGSRNERAKAGLTRETHGPTVTQTDIPSEERALMKDDIQMSNSHQALTTDPCPATPNDETSAVQQLEFFPNSSEGEKLLEHTQANSSWPEVS